MPSGPDRDFLSYPRRFEDRLDHSEIAPAHFAAHARLPALADTLREVVHLPRLLIHRGAEIQFAATGFDHGAPISEGLLLELEPPFCAFRAKRVGAVIVTRER